MLANPSTEATVAWMEHTGSASGMGISSPTCRPNPLATPRNMRSNIVVESTCVLDHLESPILNRRNGKAVSPSAIIGHTVQ